MIVRVLYIHDVIETIHKNIHINLYDIEMIFLPNESEGFTTKY